MFKRIDRKASREGRHLRVRKKISSTPKRPGLSVYRGEKNIYAQIIDDANSIALVSASGLGKVSDVKAGGDREAIKMVDELVVKKTLERGISEVVFDRGGYVYHEEVQTLVGTAKEAGLEF